MLNVVELAAAKKLISEKFENFPTILLDLDQATDKVLAEDLFCPQNLPQFNRSMMDGYAVKSWQTNGASQSVPVNFKLIGEVKMGQVTSLELQDGTCAYVPTGAMLPKRSDSVVMIEQTSKIGEEIFIYHPVKSRENMITEGEDFAKGSIIASKGALLTSAKIGVLASAGISRVKIFKPMTFSLISTGDEIIPIKQELIDCKIRDTNSHLLQALYAPLGATISKIIIKDDLNDLIKAIGEGLATSDIIIISGGSSVGYRDYTEKAILHYTDDIFIKGIALKPGKPTMAGYLNGQLILGLPGNPMAAYVALSKVFLDGVYDAFNVKKRAKIFARAKINFPSAAGRATVMPIKLEESDTGYLATPLFYKSGLIGILSKADGYTIISESEEGIPKDTLLEVFPL